MNNTFYFLNDESVLVLSYFKTNTVYDNLNSFGRFDF